jgi:hypothetical protein
MVGLAHLEHGRSICPIDFALVLMPKRNNIVMAPVWENSTTPGPDRADYTLNRLVIQEYDGISP